MNKSIGNNEHQTIQSDQETTAEPATVVVAGYEGEQVYVASQWKLMWWKFKDHKVAHFAMYIVIGLYLMAAFCEVLAPSNPTKRHVPHSYAKPQRIHLFDQDGRLHWPFVYPLEQHIDDETLVRTYTDDTSRRIPLKLFAKGDKYKLWGLIPMTRHLFGVDNGDADVSYAHLDAPTEERTWHNYDYTGQRLYLMGADRLGRDLFSRILYGSRISLSIGLLGVGLSLVLGVVIGGISGYYGGLVDTLIQRFIEILRSFPTIPLWLALSAAMPATWSQLRVYFCMTIILAFIGWTDLARVTRGKILALREEDYAVAARVAGVREFSIILRHLVPGFLSHLIVTVTLAIPGMVMAETSLSFLRLGLRPPTISWGVLLQDAMNTRAVTLYPWLLLPVLFVIVTMLMFNFLGDGLRDAADPYSH